MTPLPLPALKEIGTAIIGGGIIGRCLAMYLAEEAEDIAVINAGEPGGSTANAGSLHVQMQSRFIRLFPELAPGVERNLPLYLLAVRQWRELAEELGADIGLKFTGGLMVAEDETQFRFLAEKCRREAALGLDAAMLDRAELDRIAPYLGRAVVGAEYCGNEGKLDPLRANEAVRRRASALGAIFVDDTRVLRIERADGRFRLHVAGGAITAGQVVIAAGSGSAALAADLGIPLPVAAEPLHVNITEAAEPLIGHLVQHADRQITMKQLGSGQVVIGGGWPAAIRGERRHPTVEPSSIFGNLRLALHIVPALAPLRIIRSWAGINTTADGRSILGPVASVPGLFFSIPGDAGYTLGPISARLVADLVLGRDPAVPLAEFSAERFAAHAA